MSCYGFLLSHAEIDPNPMVTAFQNRQSQHVVEPVNNLYAGSVLFYRFHTYWMASTGLIAGANPGDPFLASTTPEGRAVVTMLLSARSPEVNHAHVGREEARIMAELVEGGSADQDPIRKWRSACASS